MRKCARVRASIDTRQRRTCQTPATGRTSMEVAMRFPSPPAGRLRVALPIALVVAALGGAGAPRAADEPGLPIARAETVGMSSQRLQRVRAFVQQYIDSNQIAGAVTLVARKGKVVHFENQGWRYKEEQAPMEKD